MLAKRPDFEIKTLLEILNNFQVEGVKSVRQIKVGTGRNIKYRVFASNGDCFLKGVPRNELNCSRKKSSHEFQRAASLSGLPVPQLKTCFDGATVYHTDDFLWEVQTWVEGVRAEVDEKAAEEIGFLLSRMHRVGRGINPDSFRRLNIFESFSGVYLNFNHLKEKGFLSRETENLLEYHVDRLASQIRHMNFDLLPLVVAHGDFHRGNILFLNNSPVSVLDFDLVSVQPRINEIANAMLQFSVIKEGVDGSVRPARLRGSIIKAFAFGYRNEGKFFLKEEEVRSIPVLISYNLLIESFTLIGRHKGKIRTELMDAAVRLLKWIEPRGEKIITLIQ